MKEPSLGELIIVVQRPYVRMYRILFWLMLALTVGFLLCFTADNLWVIALVFLSPLTAILALAFGITTLRDNTRVVEIYQHGFTIRNVDDAGLYKRVIWEEVKDIFQVDSDNVGAGEVLGFFLEHVMTPLVNFNALTPQRKKYPMTLNFTFKNTRHKLSLDRTYQPVFEPLSRSVINYWLAESRRSLKETQSVQVGQWSISAEGILVDKEMIPWNAISDLIEVNDRLYVVYKDNRTEIDHHVHQKLGLQGAVINQLRIDMQTVGMPVLAGRVE